MPESSHQHNDNASRVKFLRQKNKIIEISSCFSHFLYAKWNFPKFNSTIGSKCNCSASVLIIVHVFVFVHKLFPKIRSFGCHLINLLKKNRKKKEETSNLTVTLKHLWPIIFDFGCCWCFHTYSLLHASPIPNVFSSLASTAFPLRACALFHLERKWK